MGGWVPDWPGWWEAGLVWVWTGEGRVPEVPNFSRPPAGHLIHAEIEVNPPPPQPPPAAADRLQPAPLCRRRLMLACSSLKTPTCCGFAAGDWQRLVERPTPVISDGATCRTARERSPVSVSAPSRDEPSHVNCGIREVRG